jgi:hypothetical protein
MASQQDDTPWMRVAPGATYMGMTEHALRRLIRDGVIPTYKPGGKPKSRIFLNRHDLDRLIAASKVEATTGPLARKN